MNYISLGSSCSVAYQLQKHKIRKCAYPFDWIRIIKLSDITNILKNDFCNYIESCEKINESYSYPISNNDNFPDKNNVDKSIIMRNKYNVRFYHDFGKNTLKDDVVIKYRRRIARFMDMIKNNQIIHFVRDEIKINKINIQMVEDFISMIKSMNDNIQFKLIIILHNTKNKKHELLDYKNENVYIINDIKEFGDWVRPNVDWESIFNY